MIRNSGYMESGREPDIDEKPTSHKKVYVGSHILASETIADNAQSMIDEMEEKRKQDGALISGTYFFIY